MVGLSQRWLAAGMSILAMVAAQAMAAPVPVGAPPVPETPDPLVLLDQAIAAVDLALDQAQELGSEGDELVVTKLTEVAQTLRYARALVEGAPAQADQAVGEAMRQLAEVQGHLDRTLVGAVQTAEQTADEVEQTAGQVPGRLEQTLAEVQDAVQRAHDAVHAAAEEAQAQGCGQAGDALMRAPLVIWTSCNMGPGSGLDADTLDGMSADAFVRVGHDHDERYYTKDQSDARHYTKDQSDARFLGIDARAADADLLDGLDSSRFVSFAPNGNVGIGTASPGTDLEVTGGASEVIRVSGTNSGNVFIRNTGNSAREYRITSHENYYGGGLFIQDQTAPGLPVRLLIDGPSGNVGVGTTSPAARLDVAGDANAQRLCIAGDCRDAWTSGGSQWRDVPSGIAYTGGAGYVGIGTPTPATALHVNSGSAISALRLERTSVSPGAYEFYLSDATRGGDANVNSLAFEAMSAGSGFAFYPRNAAGELVIPAWVMTSDGNVGMGTDAPAARLDIAGTARFGGGSIIAGIQKGIVGDYVGKTGTSVTFPQAFATPPMVQLTVDESDDNLGATGCRVTALSATGFTFWCFAGTADTNAYRVHWLAIG